MSGRDRKHVSTTCICFSIVQLAVGVVFSRERKTGSKITIENKCIIVIMENFIMKLIEIVLSPCPRIGCLHY